MKMAHKYEGEFRRMEFNAQGVKQSYEQKMIPSLFDTCQKVLFKLTYWLLGYSFYPLKDQTMLNTIIIVTRSLTFN